ncbi:MAG: hypothetical protein QOD75_1265 [Blastocatellia bacterium]|jgi:hypothetical protein|nr:hypothetical protein [Blastocatellia bacterium]
MVLLALLTPVALGQQSTGALKGTVTDQAGGLIVGANVILRDAKGAQKKASTNANGGFEFKSLAPGFYDLTVVAQGFDAFEEKQIEIRAGRTTPFDFQLNVASVEQSVTVDQKSLSTDADRNADAVVLRERELEALPSDPDAFASALQALAGPPQGENGPQIKVDGFSNGQIPPKEAIREVRINQNPYSAENEFPGWGGIEIFTQPGSDKWHGGVGFFFNDESLNSRNPYSAVRAPFQQRSFNGNLTGPIKPKRASFSINGGRNASDTNSLINATILEPLTNRPVRFNQTIITPQVSTNFTGRADVKINKQHTLVSSFEYNQASQARQGIGGFSLPSRAYRGARRNYTLQMTETTILSEKAINETRLQISHSNFRQTALTPQFALNVADSFFSGGSQVGAASNTQNRAELQNFTSWTSGNHFLKIGGRLRYVDVRSIAPSNFGGTYTFGGGTGPVLDANDQVIPGGGTIAISSLERYRRTLVFSSLSAAQIRSLGGGPTQFSIAGGNPEVNVSQRDIGFYVQDEWKLRPNFTISPGLRYESQNNITSDLNFAPRIGFAWSPSFGGGKKKPAPPPAAAGATIATTAKPAAPGPAASGGGGQNKTVVRGGVGIFYSRIGEDVTLQARRFNGLNQRQFVVTDPAVLGLFPVIPQLSDLAAFAQPQTRRFLNPDLSPAYSLRGSLSLEHQLPYKLRLTLNYSYGRTLRNPRTMNINAPLGGTYDPAQPTSGIRPLGQGAGNIIEYRSDGELVGNSLGVSISASRKKFNVWASYNFSKTNSSDSGTSGSPFDAYDFSREWGRANFDTRHFYLVNANYQAPFGLSVNTFIIGNSGSPFNITTGRDTNGDTFFSERPAFATDLTKPGVIITPLGAFDPNPGPGQQLIPRNIGQGPTFLSVNMGVSKTIKFGPAIAPAVTSHPPSATMVTTASAQSPGPQSAGKPAIRRPYSLLLSLNASNVLNRANQGNPIGNMSSPSFLKSVGATNFFSFGPGGGAGGNRQVTLRVRLSF